MSDRLPGIHHVTAIAGDPRTNRSFYRDVLGLRFVKRTVNYDDPTTYHLYYGDRVGTPGTAMTFFPWPGARAGRRGTGQVGTTAFLVPPDSIDFWLDRLRSEGVDHERVERFDEEVVRLSDPDGLELELVAGEAADADPWGEVVPEEHAIRGFHGVTLALEGYELTAELLEAMGFERVAEGGEEGERYRHRSTGEVGGVVDVLCHPSANRGTTEVGTVHHVAFRVEDEGTQREWRDRLVERGLNVTPVIDRTYFRSIYFREPGGVLFEIATEGPGFALDEDEDELGDRLVLPAWLEGDRDRIEAQLPPLE